MRKNILWHFLSYLFSFGRWQPLIELLANSSEGEKVTDSVSIQLLLYVYFHMNISKEQPEPIFKLTDIMISKPEIENNNLTLFNEEIILNEGTGLNISEYRFLPCQCGKKIIFKSNKMILR